MNHLLRDVAPVTEPELAGAYAAEIAGSPENPVAGDVSSVG